MIAPSFYRDNNLVTEFFDKTTSHYPIRYRAIVIEAYTYSLKKYETIYDIAKKIFGVDKEHYWIIISDINETRQPDDWQQEDVINLPKIVVLETYRENTLLSNAKITTTKV